MNKHYLYGYDLQRIKRFKSTVTQLRRMKALLEWDNSFETGQNDDLRELCDLAKQAHEIAAKLQTKMNAYYFEISEVCK